MPNYVIETVRVKFKGVEDAEERVTNASDFDKAIHEKVRVRVEVETPVENGDPADEGAKKTSKK